MSVTTSSRRLVLGMVAWHALPAIIPDTGASIGGLETGVWTLARGLKRYTGLDVHIAVRSARPRVPSIVDGVRLWVEREPLAHVRRHVSDCLDVGPPPRIKRWHPSLLWEIPVLAAARPWKQSPPQPMQPDPRLARYRPDAWAGFGVNADSARVAATAMEQNVPMLLFLESNADLDSRLAEGESFVNAYGESADEQRFAIAHATTIVCQSEWQMRQLADRFNRRGHLVRNPIEIEQWRGSTVPGATEPRDGVLWIGRYDDFHKRPRLALEVARLCPNLRFRMIVNRKDPAIEQEIRRTCPHNVQLIDYVPFDQIAGYFASSQVFLSTGSPEHEGFPNVLLQAAASGTPIVSLEDFDDFLLRSGAGQSSQGSITSAVEHLQSAVAQGPTDWNPIQEYLETHHSLKGVSLATASLIQQLCDTNPR